MMNSKIKNYVDVLFKDIPNTKKAMELKEEILSTLNDHFQEHISEGKSENQAYTESLSDLGDIDELLKELEPEKEIKEKIDVYRKRRARNYSLSIMLYILSIVVVIGFSCIPELCGFDNSDKYSIIGAMGMFVFIALATGIIVYTKMSMPQDVSQYITRPKRRNIVNYDGPSKKVKQLSAFMKIYWTLVVVIYLWISFATQAWYITWIIFLIASAVKHAIFAFTDIDEKEFDNYSDKE